MDLITYAVLKKKIDEGGGGGGGASDSRDLNTSASENLLNIASNQQRTNQLFKFVAEHRNYTSLITTKNKTWVITHNMYDEYNNQGLANLYHNPTVVLFDDTNTLINCGVITYTSLNSLTINFDLAIKGTAVLYF